MRFRLIDCLSIHRPQPSEEHVANLFFPAARNLPARHAFYLALLPIHDADAVLIDALGSQVLPSDIWPCVVGGNPLRPDADLLLTLRRLNIDRLFLLPASAIYGQTINALLEGADLGASAERQMEQRALDMGFIVADFRSSFLARLHECSIDRP